MTASTRLLIPDDWQDFRDMRLQALLECPGVFGAKLAVEQTYGEAEWREWLKPAGKAMYGLYVAEKLVGITGIVTDRNNSNAALLIASYIKPEQRGLGYSRLLYQARIDWAISQHNWQRIIVSHRQGNEASRRANQRFGFCYTHSINQEWPDGQSADNVYYELDLSLLRKTVIKNQKPQTA